MKTKLKELDNVVSALSLALVQSNFTVLVEVPLWEEKSRAIFPVVSTVIVKPGMVELSA